MSLMKKLQLRVAQDYHFRSLLEDIELTGDRAEDRGGHPFPYCMQVIIPAIERKHEVSDPEAFCGWWKAEHN